MESILRLFFAGLVTFVPANDGTMTAIVVDASAKETFLGCESHIHVPRLVSREESVGSCDQPVVINDKKFCVWDIKNSTIRIHGLAEQKLNKLAGKRGRTVAFAPRDHPRSKDESADITWVASMDDVTPDGGGMLPEVRAGASNYGVAGRLNMKSGTLRVCHLVEVMQDCSPVIPLFKFRQNESEPFQGYDQALADEVGLFAPLESGFVTIFRETFDGESLEPIVLRVNDEGVLDLLLVNLPWPSHDPSPECSDIGVDFARLFPLVRRDDPADTRRFLPHVVVEEFVASVGVQPDCGDDLVKDYLYRPTVPCLDDLSDDRDPAPHTRPICPMGIFEQ